MRRAEPAYRGRALWGPSELSLERRSGPLSTPNGGLKPARRSAYCRKQTPAPLHHKHVDYGAILIQRDSSPRRPISDMEVMAYGSTAPCKAAAAGPTRRKRIAKKSTIIIMRNA
ncbi:unnamed protein product [Arctogadus glacialis]